MMYRIKILGTEKYISGGSSLVKARKLAVECVARTGKNVEIYKQNSSKPFVFVMKYGKAYLWRPLEAKEYLSKSGYYQEYSGIAYLNADGTVREYTEGAPPKKSYKPSDFKYFVDTHWAGDNYMCMTLDDAMEIARQRAKGRHGTADVFRVHKWKARDMLQGNFTVKRLWPDGGSEWVGAMEYHNRTNTVTWNTDKIKW